MKDNVYSSYKVGFHRDKLDAIKKGELVSPLQVQIDLTNICNLRCSFCFYRVNVFELGDFNNKSSIDKDSVFRLLGDMKEMGVKALSWTGGGEPTLHPDHKEIFLIANEMGFEQSLVTNGTSLDNETIDIIKDFSWVRFSVDSASPETYKDVKGVDYYEKVINNIKKLMEVKNDNCIVGISFVVCPENFHEIYDTTILAKELGVDNIRFSLAYTPKREKLFDGIWKQCVTFIDMAKKLETKYFKVFAFSNRINELSSQTLSRYCGYHHFVAVITPDGTYPCCRLKGMTKFNFGKIQDKSFKDIWYNEERKKFIKLIENGCPYSCWMTEKNKFIEYLMLEEPQHVNFV